MGFLKLSSIYKKNKNKKDTYPSPPPPTDAPKLEPLSLDLNLDLNNKQPIVKVQQSEPAGSGSLFDDIFTELKTKPVVTQDSIVSDFSLALKLSEQLQDDTNNKMTGTNTSYKNSATTTKNNDNDNFLFGADSIYSSYLRNISALENTSTITTATATTTTTNNNNNNNYNAPTSFSTSFSTSMFDSLLNKSSTITATPTASSSITKAPVVTQVVLDSDISDSDEASHHSSEDESKQINEDKRMTKGVQPIMERRGPNHSLQRKIDNWNNRVDSDKPEVINESIIERMKDRHRNQVKLAALRQQQQQQQQLFGNQYMVPQPYGSPNVLPHPGIKVEPQMYYAPPPPLPPQETMLQQPYLRKEEPMRMPTSRKSFEYSSNRSHQTFDNDSQSSVHEYESSQEEEPAEETAAEEEDMMADGEGSDVEPARISKKKSIKKLNEPHRIRSSRSAPNLKKKSLKKKSSSRASSRRNSQDDMSSPSSEAIVKTPPPMPQEPIDFYRQHQQVRPLRHMKSEPEIKRNVNPYQQQFMNQEWERMRIYQREQQLKQQYQQQIQQQYQHQNQQQKMYPMYFSTDPHRQQQQMGYYYK